MTALLLMLVLAFAWRLASTGAEGDLPGSIQGDLAQGIYAWRSYAVDWAGRLVFPGWNPHNYCGVPFAANPETQLFYPMSALYGLLSIPRAIEISILVHLWLAGWFAARAARRLGCGDGPALLAGCVYMLAAPNFLRVDAGHLSNLSTYCWIPLVFAAVESLLTAGDRRDVRHGALGVGMMILAGNIQYVVFSAVFLAIYAVTRASGENLTWITLRERAARLLLMAVLGAGVAGVQLALTGAMVPTSSRTPLPDVYAGTFSLSPYSLATLVMPRVFGPGPSGVYWGPGYAWESIAYCGMLPLLLAVFAIFSTFTSRGVTRALAIGGTSCLVLALGAHTPLFQLTRDLVPGMAMFRGWSKFLVPGSLAVALLAAIGLEHVLDEDPARRRRSRAGVIFLTGLFLAAVLGVKSWMTRGTSDGITRWIGSAASTALTDGTSLPATGTTPPHARLVEDVELAGSGARSILLLGAAALLGLTVGPRRFRSFFLVTCVLSVVLDLGVSSLGMIDRFSSGKLAVPDAMRPGVARARHDHRVLIELGVCHEGTAVLEDFLTPLGFEALHPRRLGELVNALNRWPRETRVPHPRFLDPGRAAPILGVGQVWRLSGTIEELPGNERIRLLPSASLLEREEDAWRKVLNMDWNPAREILLVDPEGDRSLAPLPPGGDVVGADKTPSARIVSEDPEQLVIVSRCDRPAFLLISDSWSPGWSASVDGAPVEILIANVAFRGIALSQGRHEIRLRYTPPGLVPGILVTLVTLGIILGMAWREGRT